MKFFKYGLAVAVSAVIALSVAGCSKEPTAATVNGKTITIAEVDQRLQQMVGSHDDMLKGPQGEQLKQQFRQRILDQLIDMEITLQQVDKEGIKISDKDVDAKAKELMKQYNIKDQKALEDALKQQNTTLAQFKEQLKDRLAIEKLGEKITKDSKVSDKEVENYFNSHKSEFATKDQVHVAHILVQKEEDAKKVKDELAKGGDFAALAKQYSVDPGSKDQGGDLSWRDKDILTQAAPEFWDASWKLEPGQVSDIVKTNAGFHIIKMLEKKTAGEKTFAEVKGQIKDKLLLDKKRNVFAKWLEGVKKKADIKKTLPTPKVTTPAAGSQNPGSAPGAPGAVPNGGTPNQPGATPSPTKAKS